MLTICILIVAVLLGLVAVGIAIAAKRLDDEH